MAKLGEAFVTIGTKDDGLKRGLSQAHGDVKGWVDRTQRSIDSIGFGSLQRSAMASVASFTVMGVGISSALGKAITIGNDFESSYFSMQKTFQNRTSEMVSQAKSMAEQFEHFYDFTEIAYAFTKTADSMERYGITGQKYLGLVTRAADVGAAKNIELKDSIDRLESAMRGEAEASEYLGVTLNDTYMKNMAFGGSLKDLWERLDDNTKAWYRWHELMNQTTKYQGSAADKTDTLSGAFKSLWNTIKDQVGPALKEVNEELAEFINLVNKAVRKPTTSDRMETLKNEMLSIDEFGSMNPSMSSRPLMASITGKSIYDNLGSKRSQLEADYRELARLRQSEEMRRNSSAWGSMVSTTGKPEPPPGGNKFINEENNTLKTKLDLLKNQLDLEKAIMAQRVAKASGGLYSNAGTYGGAAKYWASYYGIPENIFGAVISSESGWNPRAKSNVGAYGLAQLMPGTARQLGVDINDPYQNLMGGAQYLRQMYSQFGSWPMAVTAYNMGPGAAASRGAPGGPLLGLVNQKLGKADASGIFAESMQRQKQLLLEMQEISLKSAKTEEEKSAIRLQYQTQFVDLETKLYQDQVKASETTANEYERAEKESQRLAKEEEDRLQKLKEEEERRRQISTENAVSAADLNVQYQEMVGTRQEQLKSELELIDAKMKLALLDAESRDATQQELNLIRKIAAQEKVIASEQSLTGFGAGYSLAFEEYRKNMTTNADLGRSFFDLTVDGFHGVGDAIKQAVMGTEDLGDAFENLFSRIAERAADLLMDQAIQALIGGMSGGSTGVLGGILGGIGSLFGFGRSIGGVAGSAFSASGGNIGVSLIGGIMHQGGVVPRLHKGLAPDEFPAILQAGETVIPKGGAWNPKVQIHNYGRSTFDVEQISADEIRIIAREESRKSVQKYAPGVIAADIDNPNGRTSVALKRSTTASRRLS